ncbi:TonB family C-terminal domain-containing protein [Cyclobacterium lianum]|uniref:TonB family C-terminal domain-containing protein n=1 Tax=Cyclobacterium lianum TaxID=388280 RepID=A0A1M7NSY2_9BACT|nr:M56 family metallopeptidase [Cyclobacterium lianum]SHN07220.1 TonB family C-terminal domain-containing protein [Cyclobacterium lianum]
MILLVKFIACSAILSLLFQLFLSEEKTFVLNRWVLLLLIPSAMAIPFLSFNMGYQNLLPANYLAPDFAQPAVSSASRSSPEGLSVIDWLLIGYLAVCLLLIVKKVMAFYRLKRMTNASDAILIEDALLILSEKACSPFSFGKYIFMHPHTYLEGGEKTEMIIQHELVHVRQKHHLDLIWMELLSTIFWINPVVYWVKHFIVLNHEYQADQKVQQSTHPVKYKRLLLELSGTSNPHFGTSSISSSTLKHRYTMMNKTLNRKKMQIKTIGFALCSLMMTAAFSIEINAQQDTGASAAATNNHKWDQSFPLEEQPNFEGGMDAFHRYVAETLQYPLEARQQKVEGMVEIQFVVEKDGSLSNVSAINGIGAGCDEEAERVIRQAPRFNPGKQRGNPVRVRMVLPIVFALNSQDQGSVPSGAVQVREVEQRNGSLRVDASYSDGMWTGLVQDPQGNELPGASLVVAGTHRGSVTDIHGKFSIKASPSENVMVSFVGYDSVKLEVQ